MKNNSYVPAALAVGALFLLAFVFIKSNVVVADLSNTAAVIKSVSVPIQNSEFSKSQLLMTRINSLHSDILKTNALSAQKSLSANDKIKLDKLLVQKVKERKELMKQLMKSNPRIFNALVMKKSEKVSLQKAVQADIEQNVTITGKMTTIHIDDFKNEKNSHYEYYIQTPQLKYSFYPTSDTPILSGTTVKVIGYAIDDQVSTNVDLNPLIVTVPPPPPSIDSVGDQRTLVLLIKSFEGDSEPFTPAQGQELVFNGQFQKFMQEQSYGKVAFSGDVFGWISLNQPITSSCIFPTNEQLTQAVNTYHINLQNYDRVVYLNSMPINGYGGGCSSVGKTVLNINGNLYNVSQLAIGLTLEYNNSWGLPFAWIYLDRGLAHEMGHSLGLMHANGWACTDSSIISGDCSHVEYGNWFDTMGGVNHFSLNYNAYFKEQLGWILPQEKLLIKSPGDYTITPLELNGGVKLAKIYRSGQQQASYSIEFRQGIGFDSNLNNRRWFGDIDLTSNRDGIFLNKINDGQIGQAPASELLDMSPISTLGRDCSIWFNDYICAWIDNKTATLNLPGVSSPASLVDSGGGITIGPVLNVSPTSVRFHVDIVDPVCQRFVPSVNVYSFSPIAAGGSGQVSLSIVNRDSYKCGISNFNIVPISPSSWQYDIYPPESIAIKPGDSAYQNINFIPPINTPAGNYTLGIDIINNTSSLKKHIDLSVQVKEPVTITNINPISGPIGTNITLTGTGFDSNNNQVSMSGSNGWSDAQTISSTNNRISYTIPSRINNCADQQCYPVRIITTPDGDYTINVYANSSSASANFHVGNPISEVLPHLNSISPNPVSVNQQVTITGVEFTKHDNVIKLIPKVGNVITKTVDSSGGGTILQFIADVSPADGYNVTVTSASGGESNALVFTVTPPVPDITPPSVPANAKAVLEGGNNIRFSWNASTDTGGSGLAGYKVYRDNNLRETIAELSTYDDALPPGITFCWSVAAYDNAGNTSSRTVDSCVTIPSSTIVPPISVLPWTSPSSVVAGQSLTYTLNWNGGPIEQSWSTFEHFVKSDNPNISFGDGFWPTPATNSPNWNGSVATTRTFTVPANTPPGTYKVWVGLYNGPRFTGLLAGPNVSTDNNYRYQAGTIIVTEPPVMERTTDKTIQNNLEASIWDSVKRFLGFQ